MLKTLLGHAAACNSTANSARLLLLVCLAAAALQERKEQLAKTQQQPLPHSKLEQLELAREVAKLSEQYSEKVAPAMAWIKQQKELLEPQLGGRWAEALYPPDKKSRELEVTPHRRVSFER
jgi:hypothetical protein